MLFPPSHDPRRKPSLGSPLEGCVTDSKLSLEITREQLVEVGLSETPAQKELLPALVAVSLFYLETGAVWMSGWFKPSMGVRRWRGQWLFQDARMRSLSSSFEGIYKLLSCLSFFPRSLEITICGPRHQLTSRSVGNPELDTLFTRLLCYGLSVVRSGGFKLGQFDLPSGGAEVVYSCKRHILMGRG